LRARSANGEPIVLEEAYLPAAIFPGLLSADLTGSLYAVMREFDASPFSADEELEATQANEQQAEILGVAPGSPLLLITRTAFTEDGVAVEFSRDYHRSDRTRIRIKSRVESVSPARDANG
jgi:GntR family transcriptional regulator